MRRLVLLLCAVLAWAAGARADDDWRQWEQARIRLYVARIALLERDYRAYSLTTQQLAIEQSILRQALRNLALGHPPVVGPGLRFEAYVSANDDSVQPFQRYLPSCFLSVTSTPLLVYLHGYNPGMDFITDPYLPDSVVQAAEEFGACAVAPFGRSNTDYQGIGEQDVLRVIGEMAARYHIDRQRVVLLGNSMGGLGAWCLAARHPDRFNAVLVAAGRGDFYLWHDLKPEELPPWQKRIVDNQFASAWLPNVTNLTLVAAHGRLDDTVAFKQGRGIYDLLRPHNSHTAFLDYEDGGHGVFDLALAQPSVRTWLHGALSRAYIKDRDTGLGIGETGSLLQNAFLRPFAFVGGNAGSTDEATARLAARAREWRQFAKGDPRTMLEAALDTNLVAACHLFIFGEPERSPLVRRVLSDGGVRIASDSFRMAGRKLPRLGHGLWFTGRNPFNPQRLAIVQCGLPWGEHLSDNHRYDRIPDVIAYGPETDRWGINQADAAGFLDTAGRVRWYDPPVTPAILRPAAQEPLPEMVSVPSFPRCDAAATNAMTAP